MTADAYIHTLCTEMIPAVAQEKLAKFCDIYVEKGAFAVHHLDEVAQAAHRHGLELRVHAEQFSHLGASARAAHWKAVSADHLEHTTDAEANPGKHPNIDRLFPLAAGATPLAVRLIAA